VGLIDSGAPIPGVAYRAGGRIFVFSVSTESILGTAFASFESADCTGPPHVGPSRAVPFAVTIVLDRKLYSPSPGASPVPIVVGSTFIPTVGCFPTLPPVGTTPSPQMLLPAVEVADLSYFQPPFELR
jgi:hypothetical protein